jgi:hypothetical protein
MLLGVFVNKRPMTLNSHCLDLRTINSAILLTDVQILGRSSLKLHAVPLVKRIAVAGLQIQVNGLQAS